MGHRSTVIFNHDQLDQLQAPNIGELIETAIVCYPFYGDGRIGNVGQVVETAHTNVLRLGVIGDLNFTEMVSCGNAMNQYELFMLKEFADKLGYKVIKKSKPKE